MTPLIPVRLTCRFKDDGNGETQPLKTLCKVSQNILQYMVNMAKKGLAKLRCGVLGSTLKAPEADANPRSNEGEVKDAPSLHP